MDMQDELMDRFGEIPVSVDNLLRIAVLKGQAHRAYATEVLINRQEVRLTLYGRAKLKAEQFPQLLAEYKGQLKMTGGEEPVLLYQDTRRKNKDSRAMMEMAEELTAKLGELAE